MKDEALPEPERGASAWQRTQRLVAALVGVWFVITFGVGFFAADLRFDFFGWPFGFWVAAQGALVAYVVIVAVYAWRMEAIEADDSLS